MSDSKYQEALDRLCENDYFDEKGNCNCELIVMDRILLQELVDKATPKKSIQIHCEPEEECEKALARIINDDYYFENDSYGEDKASAFDKDVDMIEQLIEEHFGVKSEKELQNIYLNNNLDEVIEIQKNNLTDSYMIGLYNGLVTARAILLNNDDNMELVDNTIYPYKTEELEDLYKKYEDLYKNMKIYTKNIKIYTKNMKDYKKQTKSRRILSVKVFFLKSHVIALSMILKHTSLKNLKILQMPVIVKLTNYV